MTTTEDTPQEAIACPFCLKVPDVSNRNSFWQDDVGKWGAVQCCCIGPDVRTGYAAWEEWRDDAIAAWNERAPDIDRQRTHAALAAANERIATLDTALRAAVIVNMSLVDEDDEDYGLDGEDEDDE